MKQTLFTGVGTAIVTPFKNGAVNFPAFGRLIDRQLAGGVHAIIVCGNTASTVLQAASPSLRVPGPIPQKSPVKTPRLRNAWGQTGC